MRGLSSCGKKEFQQTGRTSNYLKRSREQDWDGVSAASVVQCGGRKTSPRTSTIVQFIFLFLVL